MQQLTAPPRDSLTADQVLWLLVGSPNPHFDRGVEVLDSSLQVVADLTSYLQGGTVSHDFTQTTGPHRTCNLRLRTGFDFDRGTQWLRPYMTISDGPVSGRFNLGVFRAGRPQTDWSTYPGTVTVPGSDLLAYLARPIGYGYAALATDTFYASAKQLWADAGMTVPFLLDGTNATATPSADKTWVVSNDNTWLAALNWMLAGMGCAGAFIDEDGRGRGQGYMPPTQRGVETVFNFDDLLTSIIAPDRQDTTDQGSAATVNVWIFQNQNVDTPTEGDGQYTVRNQSSGPTSIDGQGGIEWPTVVSVDVPDQGSLMTSGDAQVDAALAAARQFTLHTRPFPAAGHGDVLTYADGVVLGGSRTVQELSWVLDLGDSQTVPADMEWKVGEVVGWSNSAGAS